MHCWLVQGAVVLIVGAGAMTTSDASPLRSATPGLRTRDAGSVTTSRSVATLNLSKSDRYGTIAVVSGRLVLTGPVGHVNYPDVATTCYSARVNPSTLALSNLRSGRCADPKLWGEAASPVFAVEQHVLWGRGTEGVNTETVRISHVVSAPPGYRLGPVVERGWRDMKGALRLRPVFHHREGRIRCHIQLCWLGLLLIRVVENGAGDTWRNVRLTPPHLGPSIGRPTNARAGSPGRHAAPRGWPRSS